MIEPRLTTRTSRRVKLRIWGYTKADLERAEANATHYRYAYALDWTVVEVIPSTGTPCPIPMCDPVALKQNALYDAAWAAYPARIEDPAPVGSSPNG
jgi:hypothetical protein